MTVNHDVAGSSPAVGAITRNHPIGWFFVIFSLLISDQQYRDQLLCALLTERSEVVASEKQLNVVFRAAKPPKARSRTKRVCELGTATMRRWRDVRMTVNLALGVESTMNVPPWDFVKR